VPAVFSKKDIETMATKIRVAVIIPV